MKLFSHRKRPVHLGPYPLERLPHRDDPGARPGGIAGAMPPRPGEHRAEGRYGAGHAYATYEELFDRFRDGDVSPPAPVPDGPPDVAANLKAGLYFLDADMVGTTLVPNDAWTGERLDHPYAVVTLIAFTRDLGPDQPGEAWISGTRQRNADLRAAELAVVTASYIRKLGHSARAHTPTTSDVDLDRLALQAGLVEVRKGRVRAPYLRTGFGISVVTTDLEMSDDGPLGWRGPWRRARSTAGLGWMLGWGGTRARWGRLNGDHRPLHAGRYPMEKIKRVDEPTTLVIEDEVPRVPKRAAFFERARRGTSARSSSGTARCSPSRRRRPSPTSSRSQPCIRTRTGTWLRNEPRVPTTRPPTPMR